MKNSPLPPAWIDSLVDHLAPNDLSEEIRGDLYELFTKDVQERGLSSARRRYVFNGIGFLSKTFFWRNRGPGSSIMLSGYFKMARRSLSIYKGNTAINVIGLLTGIATALVILTVIRYELSFDTFHSNADRIYRIVRVSGDDMSEYRTGISNPVPAALREEIADLANITSMQYFGSALVEVPDSTGTVIRRFREERGCAMVEPSFFEIFDFKGTRFQWISGNPKTALSEPFSVVLTKTLADKYFPNENLLGMTMRFEKKIDCKVTGVIEDFPPNTDFPFTILVSYASLHAIAGDAFNDWVSVSDDHQAYVVLAPGTTKKQMENQFARVHAEHTPKDIHESRHYLLQVLHDIHFDPRFGTYTGRTITRETLLALGLVGLFLLITGCINYINLATAQSTMRSKEIGLRKVMGSNRKNLINQFMIETFIIVLIAGIAGYGLAEILLLNLRELLNLTPNSYNLTDPFVILSLLTIILVVTILSGFYPSLVISRFNPISALKNKFNSGSAGGLSLRKILVVMQFSITQLLVVGTFIVVAQMKFFWNEDMGFNHEAILSVRLPDRDPGKRKVIADQLHAQSFVSEVSFSYTLPSGANRNRSARDIGRPEASSAKDYLIFEYQSVDPYFLNLYQIRLLAGRNLAMSDSSGNILINNSLAKNLQFKNPEDAVGNELKMGSAKVNVVGVFDDFYSNSLKQGVDNMVMAVNPRAYAVASVKLNRQKGSLSETVRQIEKIWADTYPDNVFDYQFLDENIQAFYAQEKKYAQLFQLFSLIFVVIACMGLYGLITFVVNRKGKEVAIRKVFGATIANILVLFSKEYIQLIALSFFVATPVAYYVVDSWLSNFVHHIQLHWWLFVTPAVGVLVLSLLVISAKSLRGARMNPTDMLKYE
jgi:putative ABC transport system permease protein